MVTTHGNTARGASSPANPALHIPEPLSITCTDISKLAHYMKVRLTRAATAESPKSTSVTTQELIAKTYPRLP